MLPNCSRGGGGGGGLSSEDHNTIRYLAENHEKIVRSGKNIENGVDVTTISSDPGVAQALKDHVHAMSDRLFVQRQCVRRADPLFAAICDNIDEMNVSIVDLVDGVNVQQTGVTPCAISLIQEHKKTVDNFAATGDIRPTFDRHLPLCD